MIRDFKMKKKKLRTLGCGVDWFFACLFGICKLYFASVNVVKNFVSLTLLNVIAIILVVFNTGFSRSLLEIKRFLLLFFSLQLFGKKLLLFLRVCMFMCVHAHSQCATRELTVHIFVYRVFNLLSCGFCLLSIKDLI